MCIITNSSPRNRLGGPSNLAGSQYNSNTYRFPLDIGNYDKGHYMIVNIFKQKNSQYTGVQQTGLNAIPEFKGIIFQ